MLKIAEVHFIHHYRAASTTIGTVLLQRSVLLRQRLALEAFRSFQRSIQGRWCRCRLAASDVAHYCIIIVIIIVAVTVLLTLQLFLQRFLHVYQSLVQCFDDL